MLWHLRDRKLELGRPLVMGILNVTPDSFSDGGRFDSLESAFSHAEQMIADGADILDIGGESTRPGSDRVLPADEIARVVPIIKKIRASFQLPISIDTTKADVAKAAVDAGAEIINDISALRFDGQIGDVAAETRSGLVLMHSRGSFETMHSQQPVSDIFSHVKADLIRAIETARSKGVSRERIALDVGIGFGKAPDQNLALIGKLDKLKAEFPGFPFVVGASRKSFIGKLLGGAPVDRRRSGSIAAAVIAAIKGADVVRVHDVRETVEALRVIRAINDQL